MQTNTTPQAVLNRAKIKQLSTKKSNIKYEFSRAPKNIHA